MSQDEINQCRKNLAERMEEEVLDKYKVEDSKREAYKQAGGVNGRRRDEAAAMKEDYEVFDEEDQIKRKNGR